jgi:hypothetical protein
MKELTKTFVAILLAAALPSYAAQSRTLHFDDPALDARHALVRSVGQQADLVFVGTITAVGPPAHAWSGKMRTRQAVAFAVERVLKGFAAEPTVTVDEPVVSSSRLAAGTAAPSLSPTLFRVGARVIVFAQYGVTPELLDGADENVGVIPSSRQNTLAVEESLGLQP